MGFAFSGFSPSNNGGNINILSAGFTLAWTSLAVGSNNSDTEQNT